MTYEEILKNNIEHKDDHKGCKHEPQGVKMIFQRCKCGKWIPVPDPEWIEQHGVEGRAFYPQR